MGRHVSKLLLKLTEDTIIYGLSVRESLSYIERELHDTKVKPIQERQYMRLRARVKSDPEIMMFLNETARVGFASNHVKQIKELEALKGNLLRLIFIETEKPDYREKYVEKTTHMEDGRVQTEWTIQRDAQGRPVMVANWDKDKNWMVRAMKEVDDLSKSLDDLYSSNKIVAAMKAQIHKEKDEGISQAV